MAEKVWIKVKGDKKDYYWQPATEQTRWDPPPGDDVEWNSAKDMYGATYYWNKKSKQVTWSLPEPVAQPSVSSRPGTAESPGQPNSAQPAAGQPTTAGSLRTTPESAPVRAKYGVYTLQAYGMDTLQAVTPGVTLQFGMHSISTDVGAKVLYNLASSSEAHQTERLKSPPTVFPDAFECSTAPSVHVLLSPGSSPAPPPSIVAVAAHLKVCVMGLHRSGTHLLREYIQRFFDVDVEPKPRKRRKGGSVDDGTVVLSEDFKIWKHTVPLGPFKIPHASCGGQVVVLLTVRDPVSWIASLSSHGSYEIAPTVWRKQKRHRTEWMFGEVEMRTPAPLFADPFAHARFDSVVHLWAAYANGYLRGTMQEKYDEVAPDSLESVTRRQKRDVVFIVVRFEDVVLRPVAVVESLVQLGLPRNAKSFEPIEESASGEVDGRAAVIHRLSPGAAGVGMLRAHFAPHHKLLEHLGYSTPCQ